MYLVIDIETIGTSRKDVIDYITANVKPPATYKKAESIEAWHKEQGKEAIAEAVAKTGLDGAFGQVVCIGYQTPEMSEAGSIYGLDEEFLLHGLNQAIAALVEPKNAIVTPVVGHNVSGFDLRFLMQRFIVNGIRPHNFLKRAAEAKPWESEKVFDTMVQFAGVGNRISLDKLCLALSIPSPKGDMDGSMVSQAVADGRILEVVEYCKRDVSATKEVYKRMTFAEPRQRQLLAA